MQRRQDQAFTAGFNVAWPDKGTSDKSFLIYVNLSFVLTSNDCNMTLDKTFCPALGFNFYWITSSTVSEICWLEVPLHIALHQIFTDWMLFCRFTQCVTFKEERVTAIACLGQFVWKKNMCSTSLDTPEWIFLTLKTFDHPTVLR